MYQQQILDKLPHYQYCFYYSEPSLRVSNPILWAGLDPRVNWENQASECPIQYCGPVSILGKLAEPSLRVSNPILWAGLNPR